MDFGTLLHVAKKNSEGSKTEGKYYCTKFAPPKKESKEKKLSANIQKFLQKREQEEREREQERREKLSNLLAMRDEKSKNKIKKMLKVTKSANKSVLDDAIDTGHTAVTMAGPDQPDQDDYGYVSHEANAFYQKYIEKVKDVKEDKGFAPSRPQSLKDLTGTKERVKAAITREIEEKKGHKGQRVSTSSVTKDVTTGATRPNTSSSLKLIYDPESERREEEQKKREEEQKKAKNRKPPPPPMDFQALLKLAEKKQHEPIEIAEVKKKEPERLLTSKEKRELEERQRAKEARERRDREKSLPAKNRRESKNPPVSSGSMEPCGRIPKLNQTTKSIPSVQQTGSKKISEVKSTSNNNSLNIMNGLKKQNLVNSKPNNLLIPHKNSEDTHTNALHQKQSTASSSSSKSSDLSNKSKKDSAYSSNKNPYNPGSRGFPPSDIKTSKASKPITSTDTRKSCSIIKSDKQRAREFTSTEGKCTGAVTAGQKTRQFPPLDMKPSRMNEKIKQPQKRRIMDDEDYDSEMDDFIDDGDCEEDYSSHIKAIFGYDKSKYKDMDDDDLAMESNFAQVQREEYISKKIGIQEDLEDMRLEAMEKRRKALMKKRRIQDDDDD